SKSAFESRKLLLGEQPSNLIRMSQFIRNPRTNIHLTNSRSWRSKQVYTVSQYGWTPISGSAFTCWYLFIEIESDLYNIPATPSAGIAPITVSHGVSGSFSVAGSEGSAHAGKSGKSGLL